MLDTQSRFRNVVKCQTQENRSKRVLDGRITNFYTHARKVCEKINYSDNYVNAKFISYCLYFICTYYHFTTRTMIITNMFSSHF